MTLATRRAFCATLAAGALPAADPFRLRYVVASCLYGGFDLDVILPEVAKTGARHIDIWASHADPVPQRQMIETMGHEAFAEKLSRHHVQLACLTDFRAGPFGLREEMPVARKLGGPGTLLVTGSRKPAPEVKAGVRAFVEEMKPHVAAAEEAGVVIAIENHGNALIQTPDSVRWLIEMERSPHLAIALAPYHLEQDPALIAGLIHDLGGRLALFYAWQHGMGSMTKLPKEQEMLQLPGRGKLDFTPIVRALRRIRYSGLTGIFMHPVPRGIPILPQAAQVTAEINRSRRYLEDCLKRA